MLAKTSPLKFLDFSLFELQYAHHFPDGIDPQVDWSDLTDNYPIDIEFEHQLLSDGCIEVYLQIGVNHSDTPLPGHQLLGGGTALFQLHGEGQLEPSMAENLRIISSLSISINCMRNEFANITASSPIGRYTLPSIDVLSLLVSQTPKTVKKERTASMKVTKKAKK